MINNGNLAAQKFEEKTGLKGFADRLQGRTCTGSDLQALNKICAASPQEDPKYRWLFELQTQVRSAVEARTTIPENPPPAQGTTLGDVSLDTQMDSLSVLQQQLYPLIEQHSSHPGRCLEALVKVISGLPRNLITSLFANFSAQGRALPAPLHIIGDGLLNYHSRNDHFQSWVKTQGPRLQWLTENVRFTYAVQEAPSFMDTFQIDYQHETNEAKQRQLVSEMVAKLQQYFRENPETITQIASELNQLMFLSNALELLADLLLQQAEVWVKHVRAQGGQPSPDMLSALSGLLSKRKRAAAAQAAQPETAPPSGGMLVDFGNYDDVFDDGAVKGFTNEAIEEAGKDEFNILEQQGAPLEGLENTAAEVLAKMMQYEPAKFIEFYLKPALEAQGARLQIDPKSSLRSLGAGGSSVVVEAYDTLLCRKIALRCDMHGLTSEKNAALALRGYELHGRLVHPSIVRSYGFDTIYLDVDIKARPDKPVRIALNFQRLELLEGAVGFNQVIRQLQRPDSIGVPSPKAVRQFLYRVMVALEFCHGMGVVHRDIKPDNIMIVPPPDWQKGDINDLLERGQPKLLDFGIARDAKQGESALTYATNILGTPPYLAPECLRDARHTRHPASDVYSFSILLYELLSGQIKRHPAEHSYGKAMPQIERDMGPIQYAGTIGDKIMPGDHPIISLDDPLLEAFLDQSGPMAQMLGARTVEMSDPDRDKRPTTAQLLAFAERPEAYVSASTAQAGTIAPARKPSHLRKASQRQEDEVPKKGFRAWLRSWLPL